MNLTLFVDKGKIEDVITFAELGLMFVFEMDVQQTFSQELTQQQQVAMSQVS